MTPGERLRQFRTDHKMTLAQLGRRIGKSKQYLSELERGNIRLTYEMAVAIARVFGTTPDRILLPSESKQLGHDVPTASGNTSAVKEASA